MRGVLGKARCQQWWGERGSRPGGLNATSITRRKASAGTGLGEQIWELR